MGEECPRQSMMNTMATDPRDWSMAKRDAWLWGIVFGWGSATKEVATKHGWPPEDVARLRRLHRRFVAALPATRSRRRSGKGEG
jgi:hypothetical protein